MNWALLLGLLVLLAGASIVLNALFHIHVPLVRSAFAIFLIVVGAKMLADAWSPSRRDARGDAILRESTYRPTAASSSLKYDVIFGKGLVDLTTLPLEQETRVEVNAVFGQCTVKVPATVPYTIEASSAFGEVRVPDDRTAGFGELSYAPPAQAAAPKLRLKISAVFGACDVDEARAPVSERPLPPASTPIAPATPG